MPSTSQILLSLLLLVPYTLADTSSPQAQDGALGALLPDGDAPESSSGQVSASGWTTDDSSGSEFRPPQASNPVIDSSELPLAGESTDCDGTSPEQIQPTSRLRRSQLVGKREKPFCAYTQYQRSNPASGSGPGSGRSQTEGPGSGRQPRLPEPEAGVVQDLISRVRGVLGEANVAMCWSSDPYYRVPICAPISPLRVSPAATVEPARLCKLGLLRPVSQRVIEHTFFAGYLHLKIESNYRSKKKKKNPLTDFLLLNFRAILGRMRNFVRRSMVLQSCQGTHFNP